MHSIPLINEILVLLTAAGKIGFIALNTDYIVERNWWGMFITPWLITGTWAFSVAMVVQDPMTYVWWYGAGAALGNCGTILIKDLSTKRKLDKQTKT